MSNSIRYSDSRPRLVLQVLLLACLLSGLLAGCDDGQQRRERGPREVTVLEVAPRSVPLTAELSGRVSAFRKAEVRPQVSGILKEQLFVEGSMVRQDQSLYKIDPDTYIAEVESARAAVNSAQAQLEAATLRRNRRVALLRDKAVSQQGYEDAQVEYLQAKANLDVAKAALRTAEIRLRYTDVLAPITGRVGKSSVTQGALVTANQAEPLAVIQQLDPVYVDMTQSSFAMLNLRDRYAAGKLIRPDSEQTEVRLRLETGTEYALSGRLKFADITVDESTGAVLLRSVFPNPDNVLLPGMYVRAIINEGVETNALLVPQRAVRRDPKGNANLFVLTADGTVDERKVVTGEVVGRCWLISEGLEVGDKVVVTGMQGLRSGNPVKVAATVTLDELLNPEGQAKAE
ncbi:MAG: efflux RND transporter periplasmic adaptor subunit [Desulfovibrionaceae bacterium]|nr:efflux RND transporter periplasmic adaptor subunit [Desulfovibrionaceae bacterium]